MKKKIVNVDTPEVFTDISPEKKNTWQQWIFFSLFVEKKTYLNKPHRSESAFDHAIRKTHHHQNAHVIKKSIPYVSFANVVKRRLSVSHRIIAVTNNRNSFSPLLPHIGPRTCTTNEGDRRRVKLSSEISFV